MTDGRTDRQTGGQTDGQTEESDFIGRCPTNIERPIKTSERHHSNVFIINLEHMFTRSSSASIVYFALAFLCWVLLFNPF